MLLLTLTISGDNTGILDGILFTLFDILIRDYTQKRTLQDDSLRRITLTVTIFDCVYASHASDVRC